MTVESELHKKMEETEETEETAEATSISAIIYVACRP